MFNNSTHLVSIGIISYNNGKFIGAAIKSALIQDYPNIEIVISDDASTDDTLKIIKNYIKNYPGKIKLLTSGQNLGATENWFKCASACQGKYIAVLAGDDEFYLEKISKQVEIMDQDSNIAICYTDAAVFHVASQRELYYLSDKAPTKSGDIHVALRDSIYYSPTIMFRKEHAPTQNIFKGIRHGSDLAFYKEIMILAGSNAKVHYIPEVLYKYQKHDNNITVSSYNYRAEHIEAIKRLQDEYPEYAYDLNGAIYDFCCVAFLKNLLKCNIKEAWFFLKIGLKASRGNPFRFLRSTMWGMKFMIRTLCRK